MSEARDGMRVALVCSGLGKVWRGFERFTRELFGELRGRVDVTLFKGGGAGGGDREVVVWNLGRDSLARVPGMRSGLARDPYYYECLSFTAALLPHLARGRFDVVHFIDPPIGNFLHHARRLGVLRASFRTLFTNGVALALDHGPRADHFHQVSPVVYEEALAVGVPVERVTFVPMGVHSRTYLPRGDAGGLRAAWGVPAGLRVILSVAAVNRSHKRIDYLIEEVARLDASHFLIVAGRVEDPDLVTLARSRLGDRVLFVTEPLYDRIAELYTIADVFVVPSLVEGFCLAAVEAMCAGVPTILHRTPHFQWLTGRDDSLMDMTQAGALAERIGVLASDHGARAALVQHSQAVRERFDWARLVDGYVQMYERVCAEQ